jgi:hypothetical protein
LGRRHQCWLPISGWLCYTFDELRRSTVHEALVAMAYSRAFFDFQLTFASRVAAKFDLSLADTLYHYTTFTKSFDSGAWVDFLAGLHQAPDATTWAYEWYRAHQQPDPKPHDSQYDGHPLFGCFYYVLRDAHIIRPHFIQNDLPGMRPLSRARVAVRQAELSQMFAYIKQQVPAARTVLGNSWMYNLEAYCRLYPQAYTQTMTVSSAEEFQFLALWGQCFDSRWQVRTDIAAELLRRVDALTNLADLRGCFPYQILQPHGAIDAFYAFYQGA